MDERLLQDFQGLIDRETQAAYERGVHDGRVQERQMIRELLDEPVKTSPPARARRQRRTPQTPPVPTELVTGYVLGALRELEETHRDGVLPDAISEFITVNPPEGNGIEVSPKVVRQILRQQSLLGRVKRIGHGKFLPAIPPPPPLQQSWTPNPAVR